MNQYMLLHYGFEKPTPEIMEKWKAWFGSIARCQVDQGGFGAAREISKDGSKELPWGADSITGYNIIEAESIDAAEKLAAACPFIDSIRVYELRHM